MTTSFYTEDELKNIGFLELGTEVRISRKASIYNPGKISIGSKVRIDDFCIVSAGEEGISIGSHVHIACYTSIIGSARIRIESFVGISSKCSVFSSSDDYSGDFLTGPTIPSHLRNVDNRPVTLEQHALLGTQCVILPGVTIKEGTAIGSFSLVSRDVEPWGIYAGAPLKFLKARSKQMLDQLKNVD